MSHRYSAVLCNRELLHFYLDRLGIIEVGTEIHEELWHPGGHIVGTGQDTGAEPQDAGVALHQVCKDRASTHIIEKHQQQNPWHCRDLQLCRNPESSTDMNLRTSRWVLFPYSESQIHACTFNFFTLFSNSNLSATAGHFINISNELPSL